MKIKKKFKKRAFIKQMRAIFSEIVHIRDDYRCQHPECRIAGKWLHTSHVWPKGAYPSMQFEPDNAKLLCYTHHINWWHKNPIEAHEWIREYLGSKRYADLAQLTKEKPLMNETWLREKKALLKDQLVLYSKRIEH